METGRAAAAMAGVRTRKKKMKSTKWATSRPSVPAVPFPLPLPALQPLPPASLVSFSARGTTPSTPSL
ncbi:hypothetical protein E2C01_070473 [Portunus trituberculatus]|uniref:Uncharacterized protein n=1 Tax=Portunus trituberculatus TaxID=210409 RepID=A0A5B7HXE0_PORTR|nr:hypothetical protein [Portunus trituberculatus]